MPTLSKHLARTNQRHPENFALVFGDVKIPYGLFHEAVRRLAQAIKELGVQKGDRIGILLPNVPHFCISYYAALELGAVVVPMNIILSEQEITFLLQDCSPKIVIAWSGLRHKVCNAAGKQSPSPQLIFLGEQIPRGTLALTRLIAQSHALVDEIEMSGRDVAVINYTSGISDMALGAVLTHEALVANATTCRDMFRISSSDKVLAVLPLFHPLGQTLLMNASFVAGASVILSHRFKDHQVIQTIQQHGVTFMAATPAMLQSMADCQVADHQTPSLKYCLSYGGQLSVGVLEKFETRFDTLIMESYGLTEAAPLVSSNRLNRDRKMGSVGLPLVGVEVQIRDENGHLRRPGESGEVWVSSQGLMTEYYQKPEETSKRLVQKWLFTGDIGYLDDEHYLYIQERKEDIITKGGFQIFPRELENLIASHPAVQEVAIVGVPTSPDQAEVKACVVLREGTLLSVEELLAYCKTVMPVYKIPTVIEFLKALPKSPTGRVLKRELRKTAIKTDSAI